MARAGTSPVGNEAASPSPEATDSTTEATTPDAGTTSAGTVRAVLNPRLGNGWRHEDGKLRFEPGEVVELDQETFNRVSEHRSIAWGFEHQTVIDSEGSVPRGREVSDAGATTVGGAQG